MVKVLFKLVFWTTLLAVATATVVVVVLWRELAEDLPPVDELLLYRPPAATLVYAADGTLIGEFFEERRYPVAVDEVPAHVKRAFFAAEDTEFQTHTGVDFQAIVRAFLANWQSERIVQGGSTITQQVVKQLLLSPERSYERKLKEVILAQQLESKLSKRKILELYLNEIYFGAGAYGLSAAADTYFGVDVEDLTIAQAALLAGLPKAPSRYNPLTKPDAALARQRYVLRRMRNEGLLTSTQYRAALTEELQFGGRRISTYSIAPWYIEHVRRLLDERFGRGFAGRGLRIHTALDLEWQAAAESALQDGLRSIEKRFRLPASVERLRENEVDSYLARRRDSQSPRGPQNAVVTRVIQNGANAGLEIRTPWSEGVVPAEHLVAARGTVPPRNFTVGDVVTVEPLESSNDGVARYALDQDPLVEGALVAIEPESGLVKAMIGGVDYARSQFNRAVLAKRQPGSAFKPFVFAAAMDRGFTPDTVMMDAPISLPNGARGLWSPRNFSDKFYGPVPLRTALAKSLNSVTVRLVGRLGIDPLRDYLDIFGFSARFPRHTSIVLGTSEVTPLELARAFAIFATEGRRFEPIFITSIADAHGHEVEFPGTHARFLPVMKPETALVMTDMLATVVEEGTGRVAKKLERPAAGKTGTTNDSKDVWFTGFTPDAVASVWVGYDTSRPLGRRVTGGSAAAPIWTEFMAQIHEDKPVREFTAPELPETQTVQVPMRPAPSMAVGAPRWGGSRPRPRGG